MTRDRRFSIESGESHNAEGSNRDTWHIWENTPGCDDAYGERSLTLEEAVHDLSFTYRDLLAAPDNAREKIIAAIRFDGEPCTPKDIIRWAGLAPEQAASWIEHMTHEGFLEPVAIPPFGKPGYRIAAEL